MREVNARQVGSPGPAGATRLTVHPRAGLTAVKGGSFQRNARLFLESLGQQNRLTSTLQDAYSLLECKKVALLKKVELALLASVARLPVFGV